MHVLRPVPEYFFLICLSCCFLQDQYDIIEKHTQSGLELVEKYVKFVKERTEIEQNYAKQLRQASTITITTGIVFLCCLTPNPNRAPPPPPCCVRLFLKCLYRSMISWGQNLACLWRTHSCCVLAAACSPSSPMVALRLQAHIWLECWAQLERRREERKWEQTGTWQIGCGQRECERRKNISVFTSDWSFLFFICLLYAKYLLM